MRKLGLNEYINLTGTDPVWKEWDEFWSGVGTWWDEGGSTIVLLSCLAVLTVLTAGLAAPILLGAVGITVSTIVTTAAAFTSASISAAATYAMSGGKASATEILGSFIGGGIAGAFLPGIWKGLSEGLRMIPVILGGLSSMGGNAAEQMISHGSINYNELLLSGMIGAGITIVPGLKPVQKCLVRPFQEFIFGNSRTMNLFGHWLEAAVLKNSRGGWGAIMNPFAHPMSSYFYNVVALDTWISRGLIWSATNLQQYD